MFAFLVLLADETAKQQPEPPFFAHPIFLMLMLMALFFITFVLPRRRQQREWETMLSALEKNDKVVTNAGIYGTIVSVAEKEDEIVVQVADNTRLKMVKNSIARNLTKEEAAKAKKAQPAEKK